MLDDQEKTEEATPLRLARAREKGQTAKSQDLSAALILFLAFLLLNQFGSKMCSAVYEYSRALFADPMKFISDPESAPVFLSQTIFYFLETFVFFFLTIAVIALGSHLLQSGWMFLPDRIKPDFNRLNPMQGIQRIFSLDSFYRTGSGTLKILVCLMAACWTVYQKREDLLAIGYQNFQIMTVSIFRFVLSLGIRISGALLLFSVGDLLWQRWRLARDLRMTPEEIREEMKETLGDPQIMKRRRQLQQQYRSR